jgi:hypothetical protein
MRLARVALALLVLVVPFGCGGSKHEQTSTTSAMPTAATTQTTPTTTRPPATKAPSRAAQLKAIRKCLKAAGYEVSGQNTPFTNQALFVDLEAVSILLFRSPAEARKQLPMVIKDIADSKAKTKVLGNAVVSYSGLRLSVEPNYVTKNGAKIEGCVTGA